MDCACSLADKSERRMNSFGARAAEVLMRGARSGGLVFVSLNVSVPYGRKISAREGRFPAIFQNH